MKNLMMQENKNNVWCIRTWNEIYQDEPEQSTEQVEEEFIAPVLNQIMG